MIPDAGAMAQKPLGIQQDCRVHILLLPHPKLVVEGEAVHLDSRTERVLACLAILGGDTSRLAVARKLWPDVDDYKALSSLRTTLWGFPKTQYPVIQTSLHKLLIDPSVYVDFITAKRTASSLIHAALIPENIPDALRLLGAELLDDWAEDWIFVEQQHYHQLRLHALERLALSLLAEGRYAQAIETGMLVSACDPLRESAHVLLMRAYMAEGNRCEAIRQYELCAEILENELGLEPPADMQRLMAQLTGIRAPLNRVTPR